MHNSITCCHKVNSCVQSQGLSITKKGSAHVLFYSNSICLYYIWIANIWIQEKYNVEETRRPPWNIPWKVTFRKVKKPMVLSILCIKSSSFRAWHVDQFLYVRQWSFQDNERSHNGYFTKVYKRMSPSMKQLTKNIKRKKTRAQETLRKWNSAKNTTHSTFLLFFVKQSSLNVCIIVYSLFEC